MEANILSKRALDVTEGRWEIEEKEAGALVVLYVISSVLLFYLVSELIHGIQFSLVMYCRFKIPFCNYYSKI